MRHRVKSVKLGRTSQHRDAMLSNMVGSLILHNRIKTTLAKAKAVRPVAEKIITLGKKGTLHHRRLAMAQLGDPTVVKKLFTEVAPRFKEREGGYTRILKLGPRRSDAAPMALIEWVDHVAVADEAPVEAEEPKTKGKKAKAEKAETVEEPTAEKSETKE
jgi:large subunit ribosomal protein L17